MTHIRAVIRLHCKYSNYSLYTCYRYIQCIGIVYVYEWVVLPLWVSLATKHFRSFLRCQTKYDIVRTLWHSRVCFLLSIQMNLRVRCTMYDVRVSSHICAFRLHNENWGHNCLIWHTTPSKINLIFSFPLAMFIVHVLSVLHWQIFHRDFFFVHLLPLPTTSQKHLVFSLFSDNTRNLIYGPLFNLARGSRKSSAHMPLIAFTSKHVIRVHRNDCQIWHRHSQK